MQSNGNEQQGSSQKLQDLQSRELHDLQELWCLDKTTPANTNNNEIQFKSRIQKLATYLAIGDYRSMHILVSAWQLSDSIGAVNQNMAEVSQLVNQASSQASQILLQNIVDQ